MAKILVVEDELECRELVCGALRAAGHEVLAAFDGETGLLLAREVPPDVAILDVRLPGIDGFSTGEAIERALPNVRRIMITGWALPDDRIHEFEKGDVLYISKPFRTATVVQRVEEALRFSGRTVGPRSPTAYRLAVAIVRIAYLESDVRTLNEWGKAIGASRGSVRGWCHAAGVAPKAVLAFARAFRAHELASRHQLPPGNFLGFSDKRTVERFLRRGEGRTSQRLPPQPLEAFCACQTYLRNELIIDEVIRLVRH